MTIIYIYIYMCVCVCACMCVGIVVVVYYNATVDTCMNNRKHGTEKALINKPPQISHHVYTTSVKKVRNISPQEHHRPTQPIYKSIYQ